MTNEEELSRIANIAPKDESLKEKILRYLLGEDVFISYSRRDGTEYALDIASQLAAKNYSCKFDQWGTQPGEELPEQLKHSLRSSSVLVLICTRCAGESYPVKQEIEEFLKTGRFIIPVDVGGALASASWQSTIRGIPALLLKERVVGETSSDEGVNLSPVAIERIEKTFTFSKKDRRLKKALAAGTTTLAITLLLSMAAGVYAAYETRLAKAANEEAQTASAASEAAKLEASNARALAQTKTDAANQASLLATQKTNEAQKATILADEQTKLAEIKKREAERFAHMGTAQELAIYSAANLGKDPELSTLLAIQSVNATRRFGENVSPAAEGALHTAVLSSALRAIFVHKKAVAIEDRQNALFPEDDEYVTGVSYSPDGKLIASVGLDKYLRLWDVEKGTLRKAIKTELNFLQVCFNPDGRQVATADESNITVRDTLTGDEIYRLPGSLMAFNSDWTKVAIAELRDRSEVKIYDLNTQQPTVSFPTEEVVNSMAFSQRGNFATVTDKKLTLWDPKTGKASITTDVGVGFGASVAFSKDGTLATAGNMGTKLWDSHGKVWSGFYRTLNISASFPGSELLAFSPDGLYLAKLDDNENIDLMYLSDGGVIEAQILRGHSVLSMAFSPDGRHLATSGTDGSVKIWDLNYNPELPTLRDYPPIAFSRDGKSVVMENSKVFDVKSGREETELFNEAKVVALSRDWKYAVIKTGTAVELWAVNPRSRICVLPYLSHFDPGAAFNKDGSRLVTVHGDSAIVWDVKRGKELFTVRKKGHSFFTVAIAPNGKRFATEGGGEFIVWSGVAGRELKTVALRGEAIHSMAFSPDGNRLITGYSKDNSFEALARIWDVPTGNPLIILKGHEIAVKGVAFSPDGERVATVSDDSTAKLWNAHTGEEILTLHGHTSYVEQVLFSPDGKTLATSGRDFTTRLYALDITNLLQIAKTRALRGLTQNECLRYLHTSACQSSHR